MTIDKPQIDADDYDLEIEDELDAPKHGTTVQAGWDAADKMLKPKREGAGDYPTDFKFSEQVQLVRFLDNAPFMVYEMHWLEKEGKKSYVCIGDDCPLCTMVGDKPRGKFAFNVLVLSDENPTVQILTAGPTLARQLRSANDDPKRGPLNKHYWSISRQGTGPQTTYTLQRERATDLAEEWGIDPDDVAVLTANAVRYTTDSIYVTPRAELVQVARQLVG
jgi:hypothetical protein